MLMAQSRVTTCVQTCVQGGLWQMTHVEGNSYVGSTDTHGNRAGFNKRVSFVRMVLLQRAY